MWLELGVLVWEVPAHMIFHLNKKILWGRQWFLTADNVEQGCRRCLYPNFSVSWHNNGHNHTFWAVEKVRSIIIYHGFILMGGLFKTKGCKHQHVNVNTQSPWQSSSRSNINNKKSWRKYSWVSHFLSISATQHNQLWQMGGLAVCYHSRKQCEVNAIKSDALLNKPS